MSQAHTFYSSVSTPLKSGYEWIDCVRLTQTPDIDPQLGQGGITFGRVDGRCLVAKQEFETMGAGAYDVLTESRCSALFKNFAYLDGSEEKILRFANRYGSLDQASHHWIRQETFNAHPLPEYDEGDEEGEHHDPGVNFMMKLMEKLDEYTAQHAMVIVDTQEIWHEEIGQMRSLVIMWRLLLDDDLGSLDASLRLNDDPSTYAEFDPSVLDPASLLELNRELGLTDEENVRLPKVTFRPNVDDVVHFGIHPNEAPVDLILLGWICLKEGLREQIEKLHLTTRWGDSRPTIAARAVTLKQAMWLQFALAVENNKQYEKCANCGDYFEIGSSAGRKGKTFCSSACRTATYRIRKKIIEEKVDKEIELDLKYIKRSNPEFDVNDEQTKKSVSKLRKSIEKRIAMNLERKDEKESGDST